jgi:hypothetical protein
VLISGSTIPFGATPLFANTGITNNGGNVILPAPGVFSVTYTAKFLATGTADGNATVQLYQGSGTTFAAILQPAITATFDNNTSGADVINAQITGYALIVTTSTGDNQIRVQITFDTGFEFPAPTVTGDANAQIMITQLN